MAMGGGSGGDARSASALRSASGSGYGYARRQIYRLNLDHGNMCDGRRSSKALEFFDRVGLASGRDRRPECPETSIWPSALGVTYRRSPPTSAYRSCSRPVSTKPIARRSKSYRGPGLKDGRAMLTEVKRGLNVPIATDNPRDRPSRARGRCRGSSADPGLPLPPD
jgi:hypothetical protein